VNLGRQGALSAHPAFWMRAAVAWSGTAYVFLRFGTAPGIRVLIAISLFEMLDVSLLNRRIAAIPFLNILIVGLQIVAISALFLAPAPFGFATAIPVATMVQTPFALILLCMLASTNSPPRTWVTLTAGVLVTAIWAATRLVALADPHTITKEQIVVAHYKTPMALLEAITRPYYFNVGIWRFNTGFIAVVVVTLSFAAFRTQRLARWSAERQADRDALSAYFSPQIVDVILGGGVDRLAPQARNVAVLNCDLVGFTGLAETLSPEAVAQTLRIFRTIAENAVQARRGAILTHQGDGFTAIFGLTGGNDPTVGAALAAAREIVQAWPLALDRSMVPGVPDVGAGIDFGGANVGLVGRGRTLTLLMLGSPLERARRLQAATRNAPTHILLGGAAAAQLAHEGTPLERDDVAVNDIED